MKSNKEIITEIIDNFNPNFCTKRITRDNLIECWSEYRDIQLNLIEYLNG